MKSRITLFLILITSVISCNLLKHGPKCSSTLTPRTNNSNCNFTIGQSSNPIQFDWCQNYHAGLSYRPPVNGRPNYNNVGHGHWISFGDGEYSWGATPTHEYEQAKTYSYIYTERTSIPHKNGGGPPPAIYNPLEIDEIDVCVPGNKTDHGNDIISGPRGIEMDVSRDAYCNYTFVQIIKYKIDNSWNSSNLKLRVLYDSHEFEFVQDLKYDGITYSNNVSPSNNVSSSNNKDMALNFDLSPNRVRVGEEEVVMIQFKTICKNCETDTCIAQICTELYDKSTLLETKCYDHNKMKRKPFDPNGIVNDNTVCFQFDQCTEYPLEAFCYFFDNGSGAELRLKDLQIEGMSSNILDINYINPQSSDYAITKTNGILHYNTMTSNKKFKGLGNNTSTLDERATIQFLVKVIKSSQNQGLDYLEFRIKSEFDSIPFDENIFKVQMDSCEYPNNSSYIINCPENNGSQTVPGDVLQEK